MAKGAKEYLDFYNATEEERKLHKSMGVDEYKNHVKELGYEFTDDELAECLEEAALVLDDDQLDQMGQISGGWSISEFFRKIDEDLNFSKRAWGCTNEE